MTDQTTTPPFNPKQSRYDLNSYWGRVQHFIDVLDPRLLLLSSDDIKKSQALLSDWESRKTEAQVSLPASSCSLWVLLLAVICVYLPN